MRYPKIFLSFYGFALSSGSLLIHHLPNWSNLGIHKAIMATNFHNPRLILDATKYFINITICIESA